MPPSPWIFPPLAAVSPALLAAAGHDLVLAQLLVQRGITTDAAARAFLNPDVYQPAPPEVLPDLELAVNRLVQAIKAGERICVWGDFDVDGQTSTTLLFSMLKVLGAQVSYYIPDRLTESHGIKLPALRRILARGVELILTCDTGVAEHAAVTEANAAGVDVLVTDHHDLAETLPPARAVINPKRLPAAHPLRELPGVGVAYKLAQAMYRAYDRSDDSQALLDLVALGIVADVAQQIGDTRYLLQRGLGILQDTARVGLRTLIENAKLKTGRLTEDHIGFWLAPRLNALGRLGDANLAVDLLTTTDLSRARILALQLEGLNDRRKLLVDRVVAQALSLLEDTPSLAEYQAIVLAAADWHPGVVGIAANRLVDAYGKPVILISLQADGLGRGSARSVPGCDIHQALKTQSGLLRSFGGHPMAAGLAIAAEKVPDLRRGLSEALHGCRPAAEQGMRLDLLVELPQISADLLRTIQRLAPFGAGNPPVRLGAAGLRIVDETIFGKERAHKKLLVEDEAGHQQSVIWWRGAAERSPEGRFDLAFTLSPDDFTGGEAVQVEWQAARPWQPVVVVKQLEVIDWRAKPEPALSIADLPVLPPCLIWSEGISLPHSPTVGRHQLQQAQTLVIWTAPPGQDILEQATVAVRPQQIVLVGQPSPFARFPAFMPRLMGLIKYAVSQKEGQVELTELATALGHRVTTARLGLDWLVAQGKLAIEVEEDSWLVVRPGQYSPSPENAAILEEILIAALAETAAYRRFFQTASLEAMRKVLNHLVK